jgi:glycosyltransferase involved in cell wall biosynthesis
MSPEISVVVPTYRRADRLRRLVDALARQTLAPDRWELIVVDDCSDDDEVDRVLTTLDELVPCDATALRTPRNGGPAPARNLGWRAAHAPVIAFIDDDVVPDPGWLEGGLEAFADITVGVAQGRTELPAGMDPDALPYGYSWRLIDEAGPFFEGCNIFYRRAALDATTGFDEELGWWGEDTTLGWQVVEAGWKSAFAEHARAEHDAEWKPLRWWVRNGWLEHHFLVLAGRHPGFRQAAFWRRWAYRRKDAAFLLAAASVVASLRWRPALLGVIPYLYVGRPGRQHWTAAALAQIGFLDAVRSASHLAGIARTRIVVI